MNQVKIIDNILTKNLIDHVKYLLKDLDFILAYDHEGLKVFEEENMLQGLSRNTLDRKNIHESNQKLYTRLNDIGFVITELVCKRVNIKYTKIDRFMWNFYKNGEKGKKHSDTKKENFYSILYSINTSDGYLEIGNKKIYDVEDEAKIFKSTIPHQGFGPTKDNFRLNLNIVVEI